MSESASAAPRPSEHPTSSDVASGQALAPIDQASHDAPLRGELVRQRRQPGAPD
jgi:hypothetical protein